MSFQPTISENSTGFRRITRSITKRNVLGEKNQNLSDSDERKKKKVILLQNPSVSESAEIPKRRFTRLSQKEEEEKSQKPNSENSSDVSEIGSSSAGRHGDADKENRRNLVSVGFAEVGGVERNNSENLEGNEKTRKVDCGLFQRRRSPRFSQSSGGLESQESGGTKKNRQVEVIVKRRSPRFTENLELRERDEERTGKEGDLGIFSGDVENGKKSEGILKERLRKSETGSNAKLFGASESDDSIKKTQKSDESFVVERRSKRLVEAHTETLGMDADEKIAVEAVVDEKKRKEIQNNSLKSCSRGRGSNKKRKKENAGTDGNSFTKPSTRLRSSVRGEEESMDIERGTGSKNFSELNQNVGVGIVHNSGNISSAVHEKNGSQVFRVELVPDVGWSEDQERALERAYLLARPSPNFWKKVARMVPDKSAQDCFDKIHSNLPTPVREPRSRVNNMVSPLRMFPISKTSSKEALLLDSHLPAKKGKKSISRKLARSILRKHGFVNHAHAVNIPSVAKASASNPVVRLEDSDINRQTLVSPAVLKQVKKPDLHDKYIDKLLAREQTRKKKFPVRSASSAVVASDINNLNKSHTLDMARTTLVSDAGNILKQPHIDNTSCMVDEMNSDDELGSEDEETRRAQEK